LVVFDIRVLPPEWLGDPESWDLGDKTLVTRPIRHTKERYY
jgi:hypothetical protein